MTKRVLLFTLFIFLTSYCLAQNWDIDLLRSINLKRDRSLDSFFRVITDYAAPIAYSVPVCLFIYSIIKKSKLLKEKSIYVIQSSALALIVATAIKHIVNRTRPFITYTFIEKATTGSSPSFPSGHTSDAFTLAASLSFAFPKWYIVIPSFTWAIAVGYSRIDLGVHYPSDVLASIAIGLISAFICFRLKKQRDKRVIQQEEL